MKYLKLFEQFGKKREFKVTKIEVSPEDSPGNVEIYIEWSTENRILEMPETEFISHVSSDNPPLGKYIKSLGDEDPETILGDLQEIGVDLRELAQKYVDTNINDESFDKLNHDPNQVSDVDMRSTFGLDDEDNDTDLLDPGHDPDFK